MCYYVYIHYTMISFKVYVRMYQVSLKVCSYVHMYLLQFSSVHTTKSVFILAMYEVLECKYILCS